MGIFIGLALLKLGNPVIFDDKVVPPATAWEWALGSWPVAWGYLVLAMILVAGWPLLRKPPSVPGSALLLPLVWLIWQALSASRSVNPNLSFLVLKHFGACVVCYYLGCMLLAREAPPDHGRARAQRVGPARAGGLIPAPPGRFGSLDLFWLAALGGALTVLSWGFDQHFGGLEATRQFVQAQPDWQEKFSPEYLKKLESNRIFSTLFYPNALAGVILLLTPPLLAWLWGVGFRYGRIMRGVLVLAIGFCGVACLYWSGSKGGWLVALTQIAGGGLIGLDRRAHPPKNSPFSRSESPTTDLDNDHSHQPTRRAAGKVAERGQPVAVFILAITVCVVAGLGMFYWRFSGYFQKGATSVGARVECWKVCTQIISEFPLLGSGPGTFGGLYRERRPAGSEMAWLAHNDYLQQASDSGLVGGILFIAMIPGSLVLLVRRLRRLQHPIIWGTWLGLTGWALHELIEFGLFIPALAWPAFLLLGWLWGVSPGRWKTLDKPGRSL